MKPVALEFTDPKGVELEFTDPKGAAFEVEKLEPGAVALVPKEKFGVVTFGAVAAEELAEPPDAGNPALPPAPNEKDPNGCVPVFD